jgi:hypothetical protein
MSFVEALAPFLTINNAVCTVVYLLFLLIETNLFTKYRMIWNIFYTLKTIVHYMHSKIVQQQLLLLVIFFAVKFNDFHPLIGNISRKLRIVGDFPPLKSEYNRKSSKSRRFPFFAMEIQSENFETSRISILCKGNIIGKLRTGRKFPSCVKGI